MKPVDDKKSFTKIFTSFIKHEKAIRAFLSRSVPNNAELDDLLQDVFETAYKAETNKKIENPKAFLYGVARILATRVISKKSRSIIDFVEDLTTSSDIPHDNPSVEQTVSDQQRWDIFSQGVSTLPPQCQKVFVLKKVYGLSNKDIAKRLEISVSTVEKHIALGLKRCADYMDAQESNNANVHILADAKDRKTGDGSK